MGSMDLVFGGNRMRMGSRDLRPLPEIFSVDQKKQRTGLSQASPEEKEAFLLC